MQLGIVMEGCILSEELVYYNAIMRRNKGHTASAPCLMSFALSSTASAGALSLDGPASDDILNQSSDENVELFGGEMRSRKNLCRTDLPRFRERKVRASSARLVVDELVRNEQAINIG